MKRDLAGRMVGYVAFLAAALMLCMCSAAGAPKGLQFADLPAEYGATP